MKKEERGITLISLVITILVLLILAGVSIVMLTGENGVLTQAENSKIENKRGEEEEKVKLAYNANMTKKLGSEEITESELREELGQIEEGQSAQITSNEDGTLNVYFEDTKNNYNVGDGKVTFLGVIPEGMVARVGESYYTTLQEAINSNPSTEIYLLKSVSENITIGENQNIIIILNNQRIKNNGEMPTITVSGEVSIKEGKITGEKYTASTPSIKVNDNGVLNLSEVTVNRENTNNWETLELYGTLNMDSGIIISNNSNAICTYEGHNSNINISGTAEVIATGTIRARPTISVAKGTTATISGGTVYSVNGSAIATKEGVLRISNAKISSTSKWESSSNGSTSYPTINNISGDVLIDGAEITSTECQAIISNGGNLNIVKGKITSEYEITIHSVNATVEIGEETIISGEVKEEKY